MSLPRPLKRWILPALSLACGCSAHLPPKTDGPSHARSVEAVRDPAEAVRHQLRLQDERLWAYWTQGKPFDLEQTYQGQEALYNLTTLAQVRSARDAAATRADKGDPEAARELRAQGRLLVHLAGEILAQELRVPSQRLANLEASLSFGDGQRELPLNDLERQLGREKNSARRHAMYRNATPAFERLAEASRRRDEAAVPVLTRLGYADSESFGAELRQANFERLAMLATSTLEATKKAYLQALEGLARKELKTGRQHVRVADLPYLLQGVRLGAEAFPAAQAIPRAKSLAHGLGLELARAHGVRWDVRPEKAHHAPLVVAISPPTDVRISLCPLDGAAAQGAIFHELGHALHAINIREPRFELAQLGDHSIEEGFAALFGELVEEPLWLEKTAAVPTERMADAAELQIAHRLFRLRLAAGRFLYELALRRQASPPTLDEARALYGEQLEQALGIPFTSDDSARAYRGFDDLYGSADRFRAALITIQLRAQLKRRFGQAWWENPESGRFLQLLWAPGNALTPDELLQRAGEPGLRWVPESELPAAGIAMR